MLCMINILNIITYYQVLVHDIPKRFDCFGSGFQSTYNNNIFFLHNDHSTTYYPKLGRYFSITKKYNIW